ncbi:ATP-grasp fold amidoligase family protein [Anditalea andensis]|uniref:ATP-grasp fold amidoligase family protein n=1 Tax=Anditalea andensis TaxID=1048983 RepID=UPI00068B632E|nr:ATP-grasp fold amidoligase family protein [Anditalea andensis]
MKINQIMYGIERRSPQALKLYLQYYRKFHKFPNFLHPKTFTEKLYCRLIKPLPIFSELADKVRVREYVKSVIGEQYLIPTYGYFEEITEKDVQLLPDSFVLKANHGAGFNMVIKDKSVESIPDIVEQANEWLKIDYSKIYHEKHYQNINRRLIAEKALLKDGHSPADYKIHVFSGHDGEPPYIFIQVMDERTVNIKQSFYLEDWTEAPFRREGSEPITNKELLKRPEKLADLLTIAKKLANPFAYARVDLYLFENTIYFGEMTFSGAAGNLRMEPDYWDEKLGEKFKWPDEVFMPH